MAKILLSITEKLLKDLDLYCSRLNYERSEFLRTLIREVIYPKDISNIGNKLETLPANLNISKGYPVSEEKKSENVPQDDLLPAKDQDQPPEVTTVSQKEELKEPQDANIPNSENDPQEQNHLCQIKTPFPCDKLSSGKYRFVIYADGEEKKIEKELCSFHRAKILKETGNLDKAEGNSSLK